MAGLTTVLKKNRLRETRPDPPYLQLLPALDISALAACVGDGGTEGAGAGGPGVATGGAASAGGQGGAAGNGGGVAVAETGLLASSPWKPEVWKAELETSQRQPCGSQSFLGCQVPDALTSMPRWPNTLVPRP